VVVLVKAGLKSGNEFGLPGPVYFAHEHGNAAGSSSVAEESVACRLSSASKMTYFEVGDALS